MKLILITGAPASGKSSIAEYISKVKVIREISKDYFKICLFEQFGFKSHAEKKKLSLLGEQNMMNAIRECVQKNEDLIVDNNFKNFDEIRKIPFSQDLECYCIRCFAPPELLADRYNSRMKDGKRHQALYTLNQYPIVEGISVFHHEIDSEDVLRIQQNVTEEVFGNNVLSIDTTDIENEFYAICEQVMAFCKLM